MLTFPDLQDFSQLKLGLHHHLPQLRGEFFSAQAPSQTYMYPYLQLLLFCCSWRCCFGKVINPSLDLWLGCAFWFNTDQEVNLDFQATVIIIKFTILNHFMTILKYNLFPW